MDIEIIPAILVNDREDLIRRINLVKPYVKTVQIDVMDGKFVPNTTIFDFSNLPFGIKYEFHWMVENPIDYIKKVSGPHIHIVHIEAINNSKEIDKINKFVGGKLGLAFNPGTKLDQVLPYLGKVSLFLAMTVNPGFSNQSYIPDVERKIRALRKLAPDVDIEVDGGINQQTIERAAESGANKFGAASAIFAQSNVKKAIDDLKKLASEAYNRGSMRER